MQLQKLNLVTIVAEELLRERICKRILTLGATGFTCVAAEGVGARGIRDQSVGSSNVKIQVVCPPKVAETILTYISHNFFENFAVICWLTEVSVVRGDHYIKK